MKSKTLTYFTIAFVALACGKKEDTQETTASGTNSIIEDNTLATGVIEANVSDAMTSLAEANEDREAASLALAEVNKDKVRERKCEKLDDHNVKVTVGFDIDRTMSISNARREIARTVKGSSDLIRSWKAENISLDCTAGNHVKLDWNSDISGLKLDVDVNRSHSVSDSVTIKATGKTLSRERSFTSQGTRHIAWISSAEDAAADSITREKTIASSMKRTMHIENAKGDIKDMEMTLSTQENAPLNVVVVRKKSDGSLITKTIKSGVTIGARAGDGKVESTFSNLVMMFDSGKCSLQSGQVTTAFYKEGNETAVKRLQLEGSDGSFTLKDLDSGEEIEDFELPGCSIADYSL